MLGTCWRVLSYVHSTALNGSINGPWSGAMLNKVRAREAKNPASHLPCSNVHKRKLGELLEKDRLFIAHQMRESGSADIGRTDCGQKLDDYDLGHLR